MENNPELQLAWQFIENTGTHLFLTGKAGTGKTRPGNPCGVAAFGIRKIALF